MRTLISYADLDRLAGEVLPERTLLSAVSDVVGSSSVGEAVPGSAAGDSAGDSSGDPNGGGTPAGDVADTSAADVVGSTSEDDNAQPQSTPSHPVDDNDDGQTVAYTCQTTHKEGTPGVLGTAGLGSNNPSTTQTCTPAAVTNEDGSTVYYSCQTSHKQGTPGLMGSLGLGSNNPSTTQTCTPTAQN